MTATIKTSANLPLCSRLPVERTAELETLPLKVIRIRQKMMKMMMRTTNCSRKWMGWLLNVTLAKLLHLLQLDPYPICSNSSNPKGR